MNFDHFDWVFFLQCLTVCLIISGLIALADFGSSNAVPDGCRSEYTTTLLVPMPMANGVMILLQYPQYVVVCP